MGALAAIELIITHGRNPRIALLGRMGSVEGLAIIYGVSRSVARHGRIRHGVILGALLALVLIHGRD